MNPVPLFGGAALLTLVALDVVATTTGSGSAEGPGPLTARLARRIWLGALRVHRRWSSHRLLHVAGLCIAIGVVTLWILATWLSWTAVFAAGDGSVIDPATGQPADLGGKAYFAGYAVLTLGNGELVPSSDAWRIATLAASATGLGMVTLAVTYILNVVQAGNRRRSLATMIWTLGDTPEDIVDRAGRDPDGVTQQLWSLVDPLVLVREQHVAFPILHFLHATDQHRSLPVQASKLIDATNQLGRSSGSPNVSSSVLESLQRALDEYVQTIERYQPDSESSPTGDLRGAVRSGAGWGTNRP